MKFFLLSECAGTNHSQIVHKHGVVSAETIEEAGKKLGGKVSNIVRGPEFEVIHAEILNRFTLEELPEIKTLPVPVSRDE